MQLFLSPDFNIQSLRRKPKSAAQKIKEFKEKIQSHSLTNIGRVLEAFIPASLFDEHRPKTSRRRIFSIENTFWGLFLQALQPDSSCQSIVHQFRTSERGNKSSISASTSAYCQARKRLPTELLSTIFNHTAQLKDTKHPLVGRRVVCADGTGLLAADTKENQTVWPQQSSQKEGCGFSQIRLCALCNLHTGVAIDYRVGNKRSHELPLLRDQEGSFAKNDVFIGDKGFICFYDQARLLDIGVDSIVALARRKPVSAGDAEKIIGKNDLLINVPKFTSTVARSRYPKERWSALPDAIQMRQIKVDFSFPGYRSKGVYLLTTLLDEARYPAALIAELYRQRWGIELYFRDLKTTLGMEFIKAKTPEMARKEIQMFFIVFNVIRYLMSEAGNGSGDIVLAFKSCVQTLISYCNNGKSLLTKNSAMNMSFLLSEIMKCTLYQRQGRIEPRQIKQRPKPFKLMTKPRSILRDEMLSQAA